MADIAQNVAFSACGTTIATAKQEFEARLGFIEPNLKNALMNGTVQSVDFDIYATRDLKSDTTIELMQSSDSKKVGITNINDRKLEANTYALITGVQLLSAEATGDDMLTAKYDVISDIIANGEIELKSGDKVLIPRSSCQRFVTTGSDGLKGYIKLECPKFLLPLTDIVPTLYLPKAAAGTSVRLVLHGVKTNKA